MLLTCVKASKKIQASARIFLYIPQTQKRPSINACFMSQFAYCPLVWMNHSTTLNNRINELYKRALSLVYNNFSSSFSELLEVLKLSCAAQKLYLAWDQKYGTFYRRNLKKWCLNTLFKKKICEWSPKNCHT